MSYTNFSSQHKSEDRSRPPRRYGGPMRESRHSRRERSSPYGNAPQAPQKLNMPTVFVGNLAPEVTEEVLIDIFKDCGDMKDVRLKRHRDTGKAKGFGFIDFYQMSSAFKAIETKNGAYVFGRAIQVDLSNSQQQEKPSDSNSNVKTYLDKIKSDSTSQIPVIPPINPMPLLYPSNVSNIPMNLMYAPHNAPLPDSGDKDYISKRSNDRVEQPQRERPVGCKTVFIGNLLNSVKEEDIRNVFAGCNIKDVRWLYEKKNGVKKFKGCGFVDFNDEESTLKAASMNGYLVLGRPMRVDYASDSKKKSSEGPTPSSTTHNKRSPPYVPGMSYRTYPPNQYPSSNPQVFNPYYINGQDFSVNPNIQTQNPSPQSNTGQAYIQKNQSTTPSSYPSTTSSTGYPNTTPSSYPNQPNPSQTYIQPSQSSTPTNYPNAPSTSYPNQPNTSQTYIQPSQSSTPTNYPNTTSTSYPNTTLQNYLAQNPSPTSQTYIPTTQSPYMSNNQTTTTQNYTEGSKGSNQTSSYASYYNVRN